MDRISSAQWRRIVAWGAGLTALLVYLWTLSPGPFPGLSARLLTQHTGLDPLPIFTAPIWGLLISGLNAIPFSTLALKANLMSALMAAWAVGLIAYMVAGIPHDRTAEEIRAESPSPLVGSLSGLAAGLMLAFAAPYWSIATRAHPFAFHLLYALALFLLLSRYNQTGHRSYLFLFALLYGIGCVENALFFLFAPLFLLIVPFYLWRRKDLTWRPALYTLAFFFVGLLAYVVVGWRISKSPVMEWMEYDSLWEVLLILWREQYVDTVRNVTPTGWILVFLTTMVPGLIVAVPKRSAHERATIWGSYLLHLIFVGLLGVLLFNLSLSPWRLHGHDNLLVAPYAIMAVWGGYVVGYWYVLLTHHRRTQRPFRKALTGLYLLAVAGVLVTAAARNYRDADGRAGIPAIAFAEHVLDRLEGRTWLISNGVLDSMYRLEAQRRGQTLNLINPLQGRSPAYLRYMASLIDTPRLKSLAQIGLLPFLNEWLAEYPAAREELAVLSNADLLVAAGFPPVPRDVLYVYETEEHRPTPDALLEEHRVYDAELARQLEQPVVQAHADWGWVQWLSRHAGRNANNLGVYFEERERTDLADLAYRQALTIDTNNVSALLNVLSLAAREKREEEVSPYREQLETFLSRNRARLDLWALSYHFGYVRVPEYYMSRGMAWAMSGKPNVSASDVQQAVQMGAQEDQFQASLAGMFLSGDRLEESESIYERMLEKRADDPRALFGMARVTALRGDYDSARSYFARLKELGHQSPSVQLEEGLLEALSGNPAEAWALIGSVIEADKDNPRAWAAYALLAMQRDNAEALDRAVARLATLGAVDPAILYSAAQVASQRSRHEEAQNYLRRALAVQPSYIPALEFMLRYDVQNARREAARNRVEILLGLDSRNALANYVLATLQYAQGDYTLAENSFRTSLERERSPAALVNLAWLLQYRGAYEEALVPALEAVEIAPQRSEHWQTLGLVQLRRGALDEAEKALIEALRINPENIQAQAYMGLLLEKKGLPDQALVALSHVIEKQAHVLPEVLDEVRTALHRIRREER